MDGALTLVDEELVHLDSGSYRWVSLKTFTFTDAATDPDLLGAHSASLGTTITTRASRWRSRPTTHSAASTGRYTGFIAEGVAARMD